MMAWLDEALRLSAVLLGASGLLIVAGALGIGASPLTVGVLTILIVGLYGARRELAALGPIARWPIGYYFGVSWLSPLVAGVITLFFLGATAGELQALGGVLGLVAMANYFLRPVYYGVVSALQYLRSVTRG